MTSTPSISIITTTYNANLSLFKQSLESIELQDYPKDLLEHIVVDGGSRNGTLEFARKHNCKVIERNDLASEQETRASLGIQQAKGDVYILLQTDNILTSHGWFKKMVKPFIENKNICCTYSAYNGYKKNMPLTTRYCALFGSTDPALYYLGKSEKIPQNQSRYNKGKIIKETSDYYIVEFNDRNLPTIGDNGHMILRSAINKVNRNPHTYTHTDAIAELVKMGYTQFGIVKNSIIHVANPSILHLIQRRVEVKQKYYDDRRGKRKYLVFNWNSHEDRTRLFKYILFSLTFIVPLFESIRGYMKIKDMAWFLHPVVCFCMLLGYGYSEIMWLVRKTKTTYVL